MAVATRLPGLAGPAFTPAALPRTSPSAGGPLGLTLAGVQGFCVAFDAGAMDESPVWTRLDDPAGPYVVTAVDISRGRAYELDRIESGTATVTMVDTSGVFDPTNTGSFFAGKLQPLKQAAYALRNPVTGAWETIYRGFVSELAYDVDATERYVTVTISLVDAFAILAATEMVPGGVFGDYPPAASTGDVYFAADPNTNAVQTRINRALNQVGWGAGLRSIFSGNVKLQATVYPPRSQALTVLQDAADAEFPTVANVFVTRDGKIAFRGRLARFNPTDPQYGIGSWSCGDQAAANAAPATVVPVSPPVNFYVDDQNVFTSAIATPQNIADGDIAAQYVTDAAASAARGLRTWSAENLATAGGATTAAAAETRKFAQYVVDNYKVPRTRVGQLTVKAWRPSGASAAATWKLVCGVELGDLLHLKTSHAGGGGFDDDFFVEGLHYQVRPLAVTHHQVTLAMDVSPRSYYATSPF